MKTFGWKGFSLNFANKGRIFFFFFSSFYSICHHIYCQTSWHLAETAEVKGYIFLLQMFVFLLLSALVLRFSVSRLRFLICIALFIAWGRTSHFLSINISSSFYEVWWWLEDLCGDDGVGVVNLHLPPWASLLVRANFVFWIQDCIQRVHSIILDSKQKPIS